MSRLKGILQKIILLVAGALIALRAFNIVIYRKYVSSGLLALMEEEYPRPFYVVLRRSLFVRAASANPYTVFFQILGIAVIAGALYCVLQSKESK